MDLQRAIRRGRGRLRSIGRACDVSPDDLRRCFEAETPHPDLPPEEVLRNPFLVIHELLE